MGHFKRRLFWIGLLAVSLGYGAAVHAKDAGLPSLFRGVIVANSAVGVQVVSVDEQSQAHRADLRPGDLIIRVDDEEIRTIEGFAALSKSYKGRKAAATILVFRNGSPKELSVHLYSYPLRETWEIDFVPDHDLRFAQPEIGRDYWNRMGRGFTEAGKPKEALNAYLNALHLVPSDRFVAMRISKLYLESGQQQMREGSRADGINALRQGIVVMEKLFDHPMADEELTAIRDQLRQTLQALRDGKTPQGSGSSLVGETKAV